MRRIAAVLVVGWLILPLAAGRAPEKAYGFGGFLESCLGNVVVTPSFKWGYHWMGLNISAPIASGAQPSGTVVFGMEGLDAALKSSSLQVASGRLAMQWGDWYAFIAAEGAAPSKLFATFDHHPVFQVSGAGVPIKMTDSRLSWWLLEGGCGFQVSEKVICFFGLRRDQFSATLALPELQGSGGSLPVSSTQLTGDLLARLWIPYLGINVSGSRLSCSLMASPFGYSQLKLPWKRADTGNQIWETASYDIETPGLFLEGKLDYDVRVGRTIDLGLWLKTTWLRFRGKGGEHLTQATTMSASVAQDAHSRTSSVNRYEMSIGLTASAAF